MIAIIKYIHKNIRIGISTNLMNEFRPSRLKWQIENIIRRVRSGYVNDLRGKFNG